MQTHILLIRVNAALTLSGGLSEAEQKQRDCPSSLAETVHVTLVIQGESFPATSQSILSRESAAIKSYYSIDSWHACESFP